MIDGRCDDNPDSEKSGSKRALNDVECASPTIVPVFVSDRGGSRITFCHKATARKVRWVTHPVSRKAAFHWLRQGRTLHTLTFGPISGVHFRCRRRNRRTPSTHLCGSDACSAAPATSRPQSRAKPSKAKAVLIGGAILVPLQQARHAAAAHLLLDISPIRCRAPCALRGCRRRGEQ